MLSHCCAVSLMINFVPVFTVFASVRNAFSTGGKSQGFWWLGFLVFIQATQVQFLGREWRSCFRPPLTAASPRSFSRCLHRPSSLTCSPCPDHRISDHHHPRKSFLSVWSEQLRAEAQILAPSLDHWAPGASNFGHLCVSFSVCLEN